VVGYTPSLVAGVWAGNNDNTPLQKRGGSVLAAVPIWHDFFAEAAKKYPPEQFPTPNQVTPAKPVLAGNYVVDGQVHSILYYVDKNEPTGSVPSNPGDDPQFDKWETGIRQWASENPGNIAQQGTVASVSKPNSTLAVNIQKPSKGDFVSGPIFVSAVINSPSPITSIRLLFNGQVENVYGGTLNSPFTFQWTLNPKDLKDQNTLEVEAKSQDGVLARDQVVLYKR
jgi:penicillin-binding protein 1A